MGYLTAIVMYRLQVLLLIGLKIIRVFFPIAVILYLKSLYLKSLQPCLPHQPIPYDSTVRVLPAGQAAAGTRCAQAQTCTAWVEAVTGGMLSGGETVYEINLWLRLWPRECISSAARG